MFTQFFICLIIIGILWLFLDMLKRPLWGSWWHKFDNEPFNFPFKYKGRTLWHSRACAVASFVFNQDEKGDWYVLANKRGKGTPDFQGMWNCPCGYLSFSETCVEAARRETLEETGINLDTSYFKFYNIQDDPEDSNRQNVTMRYYAVITENPIEVLKPHKTDLGEKDEVANIKWIPLKNIRHYKWAFGHKEVIEEIYNKKVLN